jgi:hypothetical protein
MKKKGITFCPVDGAVACIHLCGQMVVVLIYVDDILVAAKCLSALEAAKHLLLSFFDGTDKGEVRNFLGYLIHRDRYNHRIYLDQSSYTKKILSAAGYGLSEVVPKWIPLPPNQHKEPQGKQLQAEDRARYQKTTGELLYLANSTRPDLAYSVGYLARYLQSPMTSHYNQLKQVLCYVKATHNYVLTLGQQDQESLVGWVDSDWAQEAGRKSVSGYCFMDHGSVIAWKSKRLHTVATSSMEAEFMAAGQAIREAMYLIWLKGFLSGEYGTIPIMIDSSSAFKVIKNAAVEDMRKHIDVIYNHVREREAAKYVNFLLGTRKGQHCRRVHKGTT